MSTTFLVAGLVIIGLLAVVMYLPFLAERRQRTRDASAATLEDQVQQHVNAVRDLDFDFDTGKIVYEDYLTQRKLLIGRGVSALIRLDESRHNQIKGEQALEDEIAAFRARKPAKKAQRGA